MSTKFYEKINVFIVGIELCEKEIKDLSKILCMFFYGKP